MKDKPPLDIPLLITYHPQLPPLKSILHLHLPILNASSSLNRIALLPPLVAYHCTSYLKDLLVRARLSHPHLLYRDDSQCGQPHCKTCCRMRTIDTFSSMTTVRILKNKPTGDCKTNNIICVIEYLKCKLQHIGETENALHVRMNAHHLTMSIRV